MTDALEILIIELPKVKRFLTESKNKHEEEKIKIARKMLEQGSERYFICNVTGLTEEELNSIQKV